jgi:hypothetical protein
VHLLSGCEQADSRGRPAVVTTINVWYPIKDLRTDGIDSSERKILKNLWVLVNSKLMKKLT